MPDNSSSKNTSATSASQKSDGTLKSNPISDPIKGSFQLDNSSRDQLPKKWIHWALLLIPVMLIISIAVLLFAFNVDFSKRDKNTPTEGEIGYVPEDAVKGPEGQEEQPADAQIPSPLPIVEDISEQDQLKAYFSQKSDFWTDEYISKISADAFDGMENYEQAVEGDEKLQAAREFYIAVANPGADDRDPGYLNFVIDFREKLEQEVGQPLFE